MFSVTNGSKFHAFAIRLLKESKRKLLYEKDKIRNKIMTMLSDVEFYIFNKALQKNIDRDVTSFVRNHQKKLKDFTKNCVLPFDSSKTVMSVSSHILTQDEREALKFGLSHSVFPPNINRTDTYASLNPYINL